MIEDKKEIILPDVEPSQIVELVRSNLYLIDSIDPKSVVEIICGQLNKQNRYSNRSGAVVKIKYNNDGQIIIKEIWVKRLGEPKIAFDSHFKVYNGLLKKSFEKPVPKPYFYDEQNKLLFTEKISGINLKELVLRYSLFWNRHPDSALPSVFFDIGLWLSRYHKTSFIGEELTFSEVIESIAKALKDSEHFNRKEKKSIAGFLDIIRSKSFVNQQFPLVHPHNDFTLRNIFLKEDNTFCIIDWDAMIHPLFSHKNLGWWDLSNLYLNTQNMLKITPLCNKRRIRTLCDELVKGYIYDNDESFGISAGDFKRTIFYIITLQYYLGLNSDRPMYNIYKGYLGRRYMRKLHKGLVAGYSDLLR